MNATHIQFMQKWQEFIEDPSYEKLDEILTDDVIFHSPVVWTPQTGKVLTSMYLMAASDVLKNEFQYVRQVMQGIHVVLEFKCKIEDIVVEGVDIITLSEKAKITEFKVMIRPYKAIEKVKKKMMELMSANQKS